MYCDMQHMGPQGPYAAYHPTRRSSRHSSSCFVLLEPTPEECRVPRVAPGVTASKLFSPLLPSLATPGPPLPYRPLQKSRYYYPRFRAGVGSSIRVPSKYGIFKEIDQKWKPPPHKMLRGLWVAKDPDLTCEPRGRPRYHWGLGRCRGAGETRRARGKGNLREREAFRGGLESSR